jgi:hypothetical protein
MLYKIKNNFYMKKVSKETLETTWLAFARQGDSMPGCWFDCSEATVELIEKMISEGHSEVVHKIPGIEKHFE